MSDKLVDNYWGNLTSRICCSNHVLNSHGSRIFSDDYGNCIVKSGKSDNWSQSGSFDKGAVSRGGGMFVMLLRCTSIVIVEISFFKGGEIKGGGAD